MSISSMMSECSVSIRGEEVDLEQGIDQVFKDLQQNLNLCQCSLRSLCMCDDRGDSFQESHKYTTEIDDNISEMLLLFKDLKSICKQVKMVPKTDEEKQFVKIYELERKQEKAEAKRLALIEREQQKMRESKMN